MCVCVCVLCVCLFVFHMRGCVNVGVWVCRGLVRVCCVLGVVVPVWVRADLGDRVRCGGVGCGVCLVIEECVVDVSEWRDVGAVAVSVSVHVGQKEHGACGVGVGSRV